MIEIRPIEVKRWHGKTGNESFTRPKKLQALVDSKTRTYCTGLTEEEAKKYSEILKVDLSNQFNPEKPHEFWDSSASVVKLDNNTMFLNEANPIDFIKYRICKASKYVADSMKEYEEGKFPEATHVIFNEAEEADLKATKVQLQNRAIELSSKLSKDKKIQIILILKGKNLKGHSDNFVIVAMDQLVREKPEEVLRYAEDNNRDFVTNYALVLEALQKSVLVKQGHRIMYHDSHLGDSEEAVAEYLMEPINQDFKLLIMKNVNS